MYDDIEPWEILIFLSYKKFYIERTKATSILKSPSNKDYSGLSSGVENIVDR